MELKQCHILRLGRSDVTDKRFLCFQGDYGQSHKFCAADIHPPDFFSYGRTAHVYFKSDAFMTGNGMSLTYQIAGRCLHVATKRKQNSRSKLSAIDHPLLCGSLPGCSRTYEQEFGYLKSPGWPGVYPHSIDCTIVLKAPQNNTISFFFNSFDVENHPDCAFDYLEVNSQCRLDIVAYWQWNRPICSCVRCYCGVLRLNSLEANLHGQECQHVSACDCVGCSDPRVTCMTLICLIRSVTAARQPLRSSVSSVAAPCPAPSSHSPACSTYASWPTSPANETALTPRGHLPLMVRTGLLMILHTVQLVNHKSITLCFVRSDTTVTLTYFFLILLEAVQMVHIIYFIFCTRLWWHSVWRPWLILESQLPRHLS